jgi:hypothetical protein
LAQQVRHLSRVSGVTVGPHVGGDLAAGGVHAEVQIPLS